MRLSKTDKKILESIEFMRTFPRKIDISKKIRLSPQTVSPELNKLMDKGVLKGFRAIFDVSHIEKKRIVFLADPLRDIENCIDFILKNIKGLIWVSKSYGTHGLVFAVEIRESDGDSIPDILNSLRKSELFGDQIEVNIITETKWFFEEG